MFSIPIDRGPPYSKPKFIPSPAKSGFLS
jgi:hypothetical protein